MIKELLVIIWATLGIALATGLYFWLREKDDRIFGGIPRSPLWNKVRNEFIKENPFCAICGKTENRIVHHRQPYHLFPELELKKFNLVTLCESAGMNCHITFGHLGNFKSYNPRIGEDIQIWSGKVKNRP